MSSYNSPCNDSHFSKLCTGYSIYTANTIMYKFHCIVQHWLAGRKCSKIWPRYIHVTNGMAVYIWLFYDWKMTHKKYMFSRRWCSLPTAKKCPKMSQQSAYKISQSAMDLFLPRNLRNWKIALESFRRWEYVRGIVGLEGVSGEQPGW